MKSVVYLCGTAEATRNFVDWDRTDADFWVFNESAFVGSDVNRWTYGKRIDAMFQLHAPAIWRSDNGGHYPGYYEWLKTTNIPVYMQKHYEEIPSSIRYPFEDIAAEYLSNLRRGEKIIDNFFTSTAAYAIALAIYNGYEEIHITGVEMASGTEYQRQRDGVTFWVGVAIASGVKVVLLPQSQFMNVLPYGYTDEVMISRQKFEIAASQLEKHLAEMQATMFENQGATKTALEAIANSMSEADKERLKPIISTFFESLNKSQEVVFNYGAILGKVQENKRYIAECDKLIEAAGGNHAAEILETA